MTGQQETGLTAQNRSVKVSAKHSNIKKADKIRKLRDAESDAAGSVDLVTPSTTESRVLGNKKKRVGITPRRDRTPKRTESETGGNSSPSEIGNREISTINPSPIDRNKRSVVDKGGNKNREGKVNKKKERVASQDRRNRGRDLLPTLKKKVPRTTAVGVTCLNKELTYAEILKKARENVSLSSLDINRAKIKRAMTGGGHYRNSRG